jgi:RNA polymerase sigma factor (sigma-70 family)
MAQAQAGDREAYRSLLEDIGPDLMAYLRRRLRHPHDVDDVHQEVLLAIHVSRHTYQPARALEPWVFAIASHVLARHWRRRQRRARHEVLVDVLPTEQARTAGPSRTEVRQALGRLPGRQRQALELLQLAGLPVDMAATRAGTTVGALRVRVHRAYKTLRMLLFG